MARTTPIAAVYLIGVMLCLTAALVFFAPIMLIEAGVDPFDAYSRGWSGLGLIVELILLGGAVVIAGIPATAYAAMRRIGVRVRWVAASYGVLVLTALIIVMCIERYSGFEKKSFLTLMFYGTGQFVVAWGVAFASRAALRCMRGMVEPEEQDHKGDSQE